MKTATTAAVTLSLPLLALAACGSQGAPVQPAATSAAASPARQVTTAPPGPQGFQVPSVLQHSIKHQMNAKARKHGYSFRVTSVTCVEQGRQKATCLAEFSDGTSTTIYVAISADGSTYVSH
jgi:hypothetical protein